MCVYMPLCLAGWLAGCVAALMGGCVLVVIGHRDGMGHCGRAQVFCLPYCLHAGVMTVTL